MRQAKRDSTDHGLNRIPLEEPVFASTQNSSLIEKRHQQIVEGACTVFFEKGYHPTTTREIAEACGMSIGQLYHYISTKDDVLYLVHKHMQKIWYDYLDKSDIEKIDDPLEKLKEALHHSLVFMIENRKLIQFVYSESKYLEKRHLEIVLDMDQKNVVGFWHSLLKDLNKTKKVKVNIYALGSPKYRVEVTAKNYKDAEKALQEISSCTIQGITANGGEGQFKR